MAATDAPSLRAFAPSVFVPAVVYEIGIGAIAPVIAFTALAVGATTAQAGFMLALLGVGQVLGNVPAAALAERIGDRRAMLVAVGAAIPAQLACLLAQSLVVLAAGLLVIGAANATFYLARQSYLTEVVPLVLRARAMSTLGGAHRIGLFIGPFLGAAAISAFGMRAAYAVAIVAAASAAVVIVRVAEVAGPHTGRRAARGSLSSAQTLSAYRRLFGTLGFAILAVAAVRASRQLVVPLWAAHIGLSPEATSLIFGLASALDVAMFYPSGHVMDRFGRLSIGVPSMAILGSTMMLLPFTESAAALTVVAMAMSLGNGLGSGIMMTLGADAAPIDGRLRFLGVWRLFNDAGSVAGPVLMSAVASAATLAAGIAAVGSCGLIAAAALARWVPRYSPYAWPRDAARLRAPRSGDPGE